MKKKITAILLAGAITLTAGTSIAYYNTRRFGFDENARLFYRDDEKISFMDYDIYYKTIDNFFEKAKIIIPTESHLI